MLWLARVPVRRWLLGDDAPTPRPSEGASPSSGDMTLPLSPQSGAGGLRRPTPTRADPLVIGSRPLGEGTAAATAPLRGGVAPLLSHSSMRHLETRGESATRSSTPHEEDEEGDEERRTRDELAHLAELRAWIEAARELLESVLLAGRLDCLMGEDEIGESRDGRPLPLFEKAWRLRDPLWEEDLA